jgi:hypothetical protein
MREMGSRGRRNRATAPVPAVNPNRLEIRPELGDKSLHGRYAQTDLVGGHRSVPIESFA